MSNKMKGILVGIVFSLGGVALWVVISLLEYIAGIAGALMGILFIIGYRKFSGEEKVSGPIIAFTSLLIVVEIIIAELISLAILAAQYNVSFALALADSEIQGYVIRDVLVGLALSAICFVGYIVSLRKKSAIEIARSEIAQTTDENTDPFNNENTTDDGVNVEKYTAEHESLNSDIIDGNE